MKLTPVSELPREHYGIEQDEQLVITVGCTLAGQANMQGTLFLFTKHLVFCSSRVLEGIALNLHKLTRIMQKSYADGKSGFVVTSDVIELEFIPFDNLDKIIEAFSSLIAKGNTRLHSTSLPFIPQAITQIPPLIDKTHSQPKSEFQDIDQQSSSQLENNEDRTKQQFEVSQLALKWQNDKIIGLKQERQSFLQFREDNPPHFPFMCDNPFQYMVSRDKLSFDDEVIDGLPIGNNIEALSTLKDQKDIIEDEDQSLEHEAYVRRTQSGPAHFEIKDERMNEDNKKKQDISKNKEQKIAKIGEQDIIEESEWEYEEEELICEVNDETDDESAISTEDGKYPARSKSSVDKGDKEKGEQVDQKKNINNKPFSAFSNSEHPIVQDDEYPSYKHTQSQQQIQTQSYSYQQSSQSPHPSPQSVTTVSVSSSPSSSLFADLPSSLAIALNNHKIDTNQDSLDKDQQLIQNTRFMLDIQKVQLRNPSNYQLHLQVHHNLLLLLHLNNQ
ncbi:MAG: hypothetical protein EZS28_004569 [Streblomastix strix]|uniref:GRAM domain-containing protein n=1 Tax=Streblomastix strix TaxID=222440 RepID=A0A5J4WXV4_9EUKA|nr:MAG: hypothetical protein EZS28_004569 [Streblomastix strix]